MSSQPTDDPLRIFLSYAREDYEAVSAIYDRLTNLGLKPWMDKRDLLPGQRWREIIPREVQRSDFVFVCLSPRSVDKRGFFQRELRTALDAWKDRLQDDIYLIPVRLEAWEVAGELGEFQWVNLYEDDGWDMLIRAIRVGAGRLGRPTPGVPGSEPAPGPGTGDRPIQLDLVRIPAGYFLMGTRHESIPGLLEQFGGQQKWYEWEAPQDQVYLPEFYIARTPVTVAQFRAFFEATGYRTNAEREGHGWVWKVTWEQVQGATWRHPSGPDSDVLRKNDHPVPQVSWHDARAFCEWAKDRLPTEAEWEKASRGTDGLTFPWGNQAPTPELCNFGMNVKGTTPVGQYTRGASPYGVLDMAGNVWEWTSSLWGEDGEKPKYGSSDLVSQANAKRLHLLRS